MRNAHFASAPGEDASSAERTAGEACPSRPLRESFVSESLRVGSPQTEAPAARLLREGGSGECRMDLCVDEIREYEHNPRRAANARFADIKASVLSGGLRDPLAVTQRPGELHYIVEAGGNTRLRAVQELWRETGDPRFRTLSVLYRPWRSESHVLSAHLIENELRGEMSFWDKACGFATLRAQLETESGPAPVALRQFEELLRSRGLAVSSATLSHYFFAVQRLGVLGEGIPRLAGLDVRVLQPRLNSLARSAAEAGLVDEDALYRDVLDPVFRRCVAAVSQGERFRAEDLAAGCARSLAAFLASRRDEVRVLETPAGLPPQPGESSATEGATAGRRDDRYAALCRRFAQAAGVDFSAASEQGKSGFSLSWLDGGADRAGDAPSRARALFALLAGEPAAGVAGAGGEPVFDHSMLRWLVASGEAPAQAFWDVLVYLRSASSSVAGAGAGRAP